MQCWAIRGMKPFISSFCEYLMIFCNWLNLLKSYAFSTNAIDSQNELKMILISKRFENSCFLLFWVEMLQRCTPDVVNGSNCQLVWLGEHLMYLFLNIYSFCSILWMCQSLFCLEEQIRPLLLAVDMLSLLMTKLWSKASLEANGWFDFFLKWRIFCCWYELLGFNCGSPPNE